MFYYIKSNKFLFIFNIQLESPYKLTKFKTWITRHKIDLKFIFRAEQLILKNCNWNLCIITPYDIFEIIFQNYFLNNIFSEYKDIIGTLIHFTISEYLIFGKYDFFTITISCFYFGIIKYENLNENIKKEAEKEFNKLLNSLYFLNKKKFEDCVKVIIDLIGNDNDEDNLSVETNYSFCQKGINISNSDFVDSFIFFENNLYSFSYFSFSFLFSSNIFS